MSGANDHGTTDQVASHTPGPWMLDPAHPLMVYCGDALGSRVADLSQPGHGIPWAQEEANARLIAAAPDLLAACRRLRSVINDHVSLADVDALDSAIAKAEGRS